MLCPLLMLCALAQDDTRFADGVFGRGLNVAAGGQVLEAPEGLRRSPLTVELWAKLARHDDYNVLVAFEPKSSGTHWELFTQPGRGTLSAYLPGFEPDHVHSEVEVCDGEWHHLAMLLEPGRARLLVDGREVARATLSRGARPSVDGDLGIGMQADGGMRCAGVLDEVHLSAGLRDLVAAPQTAQVADEHSLGLWTFEESEGEYLRHWTPSGDTNQRDLPYPHRVEDHEWETDPHWVDARWQDSRRGPSFSYSLNIPGRRLGPKTTALFLDEGRSAALVYDQERGAMVAAVVAGELRIDPARFGILRRPTLEGRVHFHVPPEKLWWIESESGRAPVPLSSIQHQGLRRHRGGAVPGREGIHECRVEVRTRVAGALVRETAGWTAPGHDLCRVGTPPIEAWRGVLGRDLELDTGEEALSLGLAEWPEPGNQVVDGGAAIALLHHDGLLRAVGVSRTEGVELVLDGRDLRLAFAPRRTLRCRVLSWTGPAASWPAIRNAWSHFFAGRFDPEPTIELPDRPDLETTVERGEDRGGPFVVDRLPIPFDDPDGALFFVSGFDFLDDGTAMLCTVHGDVWSVKGLGETPERLRWRRFASGLYQPLGLCVREGEVFVLGRNQITRLVDLDADGRADLQECFNDDLVIDGRDHAYAMHLRTDPEGNFLFVKSGSTAPHGSAMLRVAADGSGLEVVARGFRHPYGMGVGPRGELSVADNEGGWVPSSKIDLVRPGGFYGFMDTRNRPELVEAPDEPLCWIPKVADNSSGGQVWVPDDRWGGYHVGEMLHLSWGRCTLHAVLRHAVGDRWQAATVRIPGIKFRSGCAVGQFHPVDGQLYTVGLDGWQTAAVQDGCFHRVRSTGRPVHLPVGLRARAEGLELHFEHPLDPASVQGAEAWRMQQWNYRWTQTYGSYHWSVREPDRVGHDDVGVQAVELSEDGRRVLLRAPLVPVQQLAVQARSLRAADGTPIEFDLYATLPVLE